VPPIRTHFRVGERIPAKPFIKTLSKMNPLISCILQIGVCKNAFIIALLTGLFVAGINKLSCRSHPHSLPC